MRRGWRPARASVGWGLAGTGVGKRPQQHVFHLLGGGLEVRSYPTQHMLDTTGDLVDAIRVFSLDRQHAVSHADAYAVPLPDGAQVAVHGTEQHALLRLARVGDALLGHAKSVSGGRARPPGARGRPV